MPKSSTTNRKTIFCRTSTKLVLAAFGMLVLTTFMAIWVIDPFAPPFLVKNLPPSATNAHYEFMDLFPDWQSFLKAEMTSDAFQEYIRTLNLSQYDPQDEEQALWVFWRDDFGPPWWKPSRDLSGTFVSYQDDVWLYTKLENGFVYAKEFSH